jgi:hypothetical protein
MIVLYFGVYLLMLHSQQVKNYKILLEQHLNKIEQMMMAEEILFLDNMQVN